MNAPLHTQTRALAIIVRTLPDVIATKNKIFTIKQPFEVKTDQNVPTVVHIITETCTHTQRSAVSDLTGPPTDII